MRNKPFLTTGALFMGLILVLGAIGIVNGLWSKNLEINGTVTTGDLNADWDCAWTNDDGTSTGDGPDCPTTPVGADIGNDPFGSFPPFPYSVPFVQKDVGECDVNVDPAEDDGDTDFGAQVAEVTIVNAYPSYECTISLLLTNTGSIPFNISGSSVLAIAPPLEGNCTLPTAEDGDGDPIPYQVDPGEEAEVSCIVHVMQAAAQNVCTGVTTNPASAVEVSVAETCTNVPLTTYSFSITVCVAQWNETASYAACTAANTEGPP